MKYAAFQPPFEGRPRLNHPSVYGASPNKPFFYMLPCAGLRPITFSVDHPLPTGLHLDEASGMISGICPFETDDIYTIRAANSLGSAEKKLRLLIKPDAILQTPLMGFTSWNAFGGGVTQADIRRTA
ncbi:MAG: alpha-galactosidase, partial [Clostridia bacterium]|nr:alpha-galactosidase [Clostridia bacterium]